MARRREFNEAEVVERAMELFWLQGYGATSPQNLVQATGLSKSSLYATFGSKQGLFLAALQHYIDDQIHQVRAMTAVGSLRENLERMYDVLIEMAVGGRTCLLCSSSIEAPMDHPEVAALVCKGQGAVEQVLLERLVRARQEGEITEDRDLQAMARFIVNNNMGLMVQARSNPNPDQLRPIAAEIIRAIC
ncbi:MAG: TetR/AcrR family transcriptional repressor of nem operon [Myxococcota bacterium]|jgi:TetR/AcrR family transcriptional repressor of nem operon